MTLARRRLEKDFAFVGIVEQWALSACLFSVRFGTPCGPQLMVNSRPTLMKGKAAKLNRTPATLYMASSELRELFADPYDTQLYAWARERFDGELKKFDVTPERCARELCPAAASHFV